MRSSDRYGKNLADDTTCGDATVMLIAPAKLDTLADNGGSHGTRRKAAPTCRRRLSRVSMRA